MMQNTQTDRHYWAKRCYSCLLYLYPVGHRRLYGPLMLQTFLDQYRETLMVEGQIGPAFWLAVIEDETKSALREQITSIQDHIPVLLSSGQQGIRSGCLLGILASAAIIWTNVLFPTIDLGIADSVSYPVSFASILFFFCLSGFLASRQRNSIRAGALAGSLTGLIGFVIAVLTFFVIDNIWLQLVSQQADKLSGFQQSTFHSMRDYINAGLLRGLLWGIPIVIGIGALCGLFGGAVGKMGNRGKKSF